MKQKEEQKPIKDEGSHAVGLGENAYVKRQALKNLPAAKQVEQKRTAAGWVWVRKEKICRQVHPDKVPKLLADNWFVASVRA